MHSITALQDGRSVHAAQYHKLGMVYGKIRPKRSILNHPYGPKSWNLLAFQAGPSHKLMQIICLDDLLLAAPTKEQLLVNLSTAVWLFISLGFLINIPKSITTPICCLEFLGFVMDTETMTISLPVHKIHSIQKEVSRLLSLKKMPMRDLACLIETLVAIKLAVWIGSLHYRALQDLKIQSLWQHLSDQTTLSLSEEAQADLQWWLSDLSSNCSATIVKPEASIVIETDASKSGWGAVCQGVYRNWWQVNIRGSWIAHQFIVVFLALQSFLKDKTKLRWQFWSDQTIKMP